MSPITLNAQCHIRNLRKAAQCTEPASKIERRTYFWLDEYWLGADEYIGWLSDQDASFLCLLVAEAMESLK